MANFNYNKVILGGRLCADPELKQTNGGTPVVSFNIAVNRRYQKEGEAQADFFTIVAWSKTAEFVSKHFRKGSSICITGELQTRSWTDKEGSKRYATEIIASEVNFVDSKGEAAETPAAPAAPSATSVPPVPPASQYVPDQYTAPAGGYRELGDDEELPF